MQAKQSPD